MDSSWFDSSRFVEFACGKSSLCCCLVDALGNTFWRTCGLGFRVSYSIAQWCSAEYVIWLVVFFYSYANTRAKYLKKINENVICRNFRFPFVRIVRGKLHTSNANKQGKQWIWRRSNWVYLNTHNSPSIYLNKYMYTELRSMRGSWDFTEVGDFVGWFLPTSSLCGFVYANKTHVALASPTS